MRAESSKQRCPALCSNYKIVFTSILLLGLILKIKYLTLETIQLNIAQSCRLAFVKVETNFPGAVEGQSAPDPASVERAYIKVKISYKAISPKQRHPTLSLL